VVTVTFVFPGLSGVEARFDSRQSLGEAVLVLVEAGLLPPAAARVGLFRSVLSGRLVSAVGPFALEGCVTGDVLWAVS
jgi:hypothetical protein